MDEESQEDDNITEQPDPSTIEDKEGNPFYQEEFDTTKGRDKNETLEEKKARKARVKEEKRLARQNKTRKKDKKRRQRTAQKYNKNRK